MKRRFFFIILLVPVLFACSKKKDNGPCYDCTAISGGNTYNKSICTDGVAEEEVMPQSDANGQLGWHCTQRP